MSATSRQNLSTLDAASPWKHGRVPVIGLIGAIGGGKTEVARLLRARGAYVIDADAIGHEIIEEPESRDQVVARFGTQILRPSNELRVGGSSIDRRRLAEIVFADPEALRALEAIVHPRMRRVVDRRIHNALFEGEPTAIVLDAAILLEADWQDLCDRIIFVDAPAACRLERVARQRRWTSETLASREAAQWPLERKRRHADFTILNDADLEQLEQQLDQILTTLGLSRETASIS